MFRISKISAVMTWLVLIPAAVFAQASITGVVQDTSGGVVPGVTVEAASPALIEKVRSVVTDASGQYRIVDLRPGTYTVTFTLPGFTTVRREGIELTGSFTATVNAELRAGALEETITVTGEAPIVDVQSARQERVITHEVADALPSARLQASLAVLIPGVSMTQFSNVSGMGSQDVGGSTGDQITTLRIHGGRSADQRLMVNGLPVGRVDMPELGAYTPDLSATQEIVVETGGFSAETAVGGIRLQIIPRDGGNIFSGTVFGSYASEQLASSNLTADLKARGLTQVNSIKGNGDFNPGFGGPIKRDKLWFYAAGRYMFYENYAAGMYRDSTRNDPNVWTWNPDLGEPALNTQHIQDGQGRLTWQAAAKHKVGFSYTDVGNCKCFFNLSPTVAEGPRTTWRLHQITGNWTAPLTNRILFEAGLLSNLSERQKQSVQPDMNRLNISVLEQSNNLVYKAPAQGIGAAGISTDGKTYKNYYRAALSYITGAHAFRAGFSNGWGEKNTYSFAVNPQLPYNYRSNNGVPNRVTLFAKPFNDVWKMDADLGIYAQDTWTIDRLTLNGGALFSYYKSHFAQVYYGPSPLVPNRNFIVPETPQLAWKDLVPRLGAAYDVFGTGKTAVNVSLNKYLYGEAITQFWGNPSLDLVNTTFRNWTDTNRNFVPDCDLANPAINGECQALADPNFGNPRKGTTFDPDVKFGWGKRPFNWEFSTGVRHQLLPRVSAEASYFRRSFGNFVLGGGRGGDTQLLGSGAAADNRAISPSDLDPFCIVAPTNLGLPGGGGNQICGLFDLNPTKFGVPADNYVTFSNQYGKQIENWNGADVVFNARISQGVIVQGGLSTGRTTSDVCGIVTRIPEVFVTATLNTPTQYCRVVAPFQTQYKFLGAYTLPRVGVQVAGTFQSVPGPQLSSNLVVPSAVVAQSLGRPLSGGAANVTVNLIPPGTMFGDRLNQLDLRFSKTLRFGRTRTALNFDLYNALNANPVTTYGNAYATFLQPQQVLAARFGKVSVQFNF